nr:exopolysaccharide biosynthesis polyprenyl glycosylphosphotransferase [Prochlorococcus marinus]
MLRGKLRESSTILNQFQRLFDPFFLTNISFLIFNQNQITINFNYFLIFFINLILLNLSNLYESYRLKNLYKLIPKIFYLSCSISIFNNIFTVFSKNYNNFQLLNFFIYCFLFLVVHHILTRILLRVLRINGCNSRNIIFFGNKNSFRNLLIQIAKNPWLGYKVIYWFSPNSNDHKKRTSIESKTYNCIGGIKDFKKKINNEEIDKIIFSYENSDNISLEKILKVVGDSCISSSFLIDKKIPSMSLKKENFGDNLALNIWNPEVSKFSKKIKRLVDFSLAICFLLFFMPLFLLVALLIKFSSKGPIIYYQNRYGLNGKVFKMYKFRTMFFNPKLDHSKLIQAKKGDKRITFIGRILRRYSLDELPQLLNVIKGEMSLVGPRPHATQHNEFYRKVITGYMQRHSNLPGMTGLAQIEGERGETNTIKKMKRRIQYDMEYNNDWNLLNDFLILIKTILVVIKGDAY